jgi:tetratricopeptide (TPR) repeat protein
MIPKYLLILLFCVSCFHALAQSGKATEVDSLKALLNGQHPADTQMVNWLNEVSKAYDRTPDSGLYYASQAYTLAQKLDFTSGAAQALSEAGYHAWIKQKVDSAQQLYEKALGLYQMIGDHKMTGKCLTRLGIYADTKGEYDEAFSYYQQALKVYIKLDDQSGQSGCYNNLGLVHDLTGQKDSAIYYYQKSVDIDKMMGELNWAAMGLSNIGILFSGMGNYPGLSRLTFSKHQFAFIPDRTSP